MTVDKAIEVIRKKEPLMTIRSCLEYKDFYLFVLAPLYIQDYDDYVTGTVFPIVNKRTGKISQYDILSDYDAYMNAKEIAV